VVSLVRPRQYDGPRPRAQLPYPLLVLAAVVCLAVLWAVERHAASLTHPRYGDMVAAARTMQAGMRVVAAERAGQGLMQSPEIDRNRTGLIGPEYTAITTSLGLLDAKRTAASPDLAAAIVRAIDPLGLAPGDPVLVTLSGSLVGGNLATLAALETLGLRPIVLTSVSASMWGATDPDFTWLDMERALAASGVLAGSSRFALRGGIGGVARGLDPEAQAALDAAIARHGAQPVEADDLEALVARLEGLLLDAAGGAPTLLVNAGGSTVALGTCPESAAIPPGLSHRPLPCSDGVPGLVMRLAERGVPVLHLLDMRRLALDWGLPFDAHPLPAIGESPRVYGGGLFAS
jgi:poly-gamma-glutamate system protein